MIARRRKVGVILCSIKPIILSYEVHIASNTNRSRYFPLASLIYTHHSNRERGKKKNKNMGMFASLNIRPCRILIIDEILCLLFSCSFSRFAHSTDSSMLARLACYNKDVENTHSKDFSCLSAVLFHRTREEKTKKRRKKISKERIS